jgi:hypothetical protein
MLWGDEDDKNHRMHDVGWNVEGDKRNLNLAATHSTPM